DVLRPQARRDRRLRRDGGGAARPAERTLRRGGAGGVIRQALRRLTAWVTAHPMVAFIVFFAGFPFLVPYQALATQVLIFGLFALPLHPLGLPGMSLSLRDPLAFYFSSYVLVVLAVAAPKRILDSPFGAVLQAIRENSDRAVACGYDIDRIKLLSFVFSASFAGLAGALDALRLTVVPVDSLYYTTSAQVVIMTLLGGAGTFFGPFVG